MLLGLRENIGVKSPQHHQRSHGKRKKDQSYQVCLSWHVIPSAMLQWTKKVLTTRQAEADTSALPTLQNCEPTPNDLLGNSGDKVSLSSPCWPQTWGPPASAAPHTAEITVPSLNFAKALRYKLSNLRSFFFLL